MPHVPHQRPHRQRHHPDKEYIEDRLRDTLRQHIEHQRDNEHQRHADMPRHLLPELIDNHADAVQSAPNHKIPRRPVPKATQQHGDERVEVAHQQFAAFGFLFRDAYSHKDAHSCSNNDGCHHPAAAEDEHDKAYQPQPEIGAEGRVPVTAKRDVKVALQPPAQRHVPAFPEVRRVRSLVGRVEVLRQVEAHQHSHANGNVRIAREIGIDLQRVAEQGTEVLEAAEEQRVLKDAVDEVHSQVVREYQLLHQTVHNPEDRHAKLPTTQEVRFIELRDELGCPHNGPCHQLREEADVEAKVEDVAHRLHFPPKDVHRVADDLKREERDAHREHDFVHVEEVLPAKDIAHPREDIEHAEMDVEEVVDDVGEEIGILEVAEQREVDDDAQHEPGLPFPFGRRGVDALGDEEVRARHEHQYQHKQSAGLVIEEQADEEQEGITQQALAVNQAENGKDNGKERPEIELREQQGRILLKEENVFKEGYHLLHSALSLTC